MDAKAAIEQCAKLVEDFQITNTPDKAYLSPRSEGNRNCLAYAEVMRSIVVPKLTPLETQLLEALREAHEHLNYCNYGDKWEHECAVEAKLDKRIQEAIDAADAQEAA